MLSRTVSMTDSPAAVTKCTWRTLRNSGTVNAAHHPAAMRKAIRTAPVVEISPVAGPTLISTIAATNGTVEPT